MVRNNADELEKLFDGDELIQQERKHLEELQNEMREKLRQAEVELSMERAKLARERADLDEMLTNLETAAPKQSDSKAESEPRGRWLSRMGLDGGDKKKK